MADELILKLKECWSVIQDLEDEKQRKLEECNRLTQQLTTSMVHDANIFIDNVGNMTTELKEVVNRHREHLEIYRQFHQPNDNNTNPANPVNPVNSANPAYQGDFKGRKNGRIIKRSTNTLKRQRNQRGPRIATRDLHDESPIKGPKIAKHA